jgi:hypothetical protein
MAQEAHAPATGPVLVHAHDRRINYLHRRIMTGGAL